MQGRSTKSDELQISETPRAPLTPPAETQVASSPLRTPAPSSVWQNALDRFSDGVGPQPQPHVLDLKLDAHSLFRDSVALYRFPQDLFIPGGADWQQHWFLPPPASQRYSRSWTSPTGGPNIADYSTGHAWAYGAVSPGLSFVHTEAGVGFVFTPTAALATYKISPTVNLLGTYRWDIATTAFAGGTITERGGIYTTAWEISPVDGSLDLVRPFGFAPLFDELFINQGTIPVTPISASWAGGPVALNVMLQGGHSYLIGVVAAVEIRNGWTDSQGHPIPTLPGDSTWHAWCTVDMVVPSVAVDPVTVYIR
jgi:hypothetical protein